MNATFAKAEHRPFVTDTKDPAGVPESTISRRTIVSSIPAETPGGVNNAFRRFDASLTGILLQ
jgi:hypothetical protein